MARTIDRNPYPFSTAKAASKDKAIEWITANRLSARSLGVSHQSLSDIALQHLQSHNRALVDPLNQQRFLSQAIAEVLKPRDLQGTVKQWQPTIRLILKNCPNLAINFDTLSPRVQNCLRVAQIYQNLLRERNLLDQSELLWRSLDYPIEKQPFWIYGYFVPFWDEIAFINALAGEDSRFFLPSLDRAVFEYYQPLLQWLSAQEWQVELQPSLPKTVGDRLAQRFITPNEEAIAGVSLQVYGTREAEMRGILKQIKQKLTDGIPAREIAIVAQNETNYGSQLLDLAWEYQISLRVLYEVPLRSTRLGAWLQLLLEAIATQFPFEVTAKLLSHPIASNPDREFWIVARRNRPAGFKQWQAIATQHLDLDLKALKLSNHRKRRDNWVSDWQKIFQAFNLQQRCARWSREITAFNRLDEALIQLARPEGELLSLQQFLEEFQDLISLLTTPAQPGRGGVELHSPSRLMGSRYAYLFVMGMAEGIFPAAIVDDPVLDFCDRRPLQALQIPLPDAKALYQWEWLTFYHLLQVASTELVFSYAVLDGKRELLPSPYLDRLKLPKAPLPELPLASLEEVRADTLRRSSTTADPVLQWAIHAYQVELNREISPKQDEYDGIIGINIDPDDLSFSISQLTALAQCPFQWFTQKLLKLKEIEEISEELSSSLRGNLYHKVMELLLQPLLGDRPDPVSIRQQLQDLNRLHKAFLEAEKHFPLEAIPAWELQRAEHLQILACTLADPSFLPDGVQPVAIEQPFEGNWQGLRIKGQIDRIDESDRGWILIDYKTRSSPPKGVPDAKREKTFDLQLPLYQILSETLFPDRPIAESYYYSLTKGAKLEVDAKKLPSEEELAHFIDRCKSHLTNGQFPVLPYTPNDPCQYCDYDLICRQGSRLSQKENLHGSDE